MTKKKHRAYAILNKYRLYRTDERRVVYGVVDRDFICPQISTLTDAHGNCYTVVTGVPLKHNEEGVFVLERLFYEITPMNPGLYASDTHYCYWLLITDEDE